ncbi:MAG: ribosomal L7Ae/L30e/S12e/Gadd45 family protein [Candidatus Aenigmarchaeota archaeon]|nr:ribosomal L7Ae/L30e/S12e/Gadd45 family protein [Candidatus Aenigmarchaeota archaeon]
MEAIVRQLQEGKLVLGTNKTLKMLREGKIALVYTTLSTPEETKKKLDGIDTKKLKATATELGKTLGKNFPIAICGVRK